MAEKLTKSQTDVLDEVFDKGAVRAETMNAKTRDSLKRRGYLSDYNAWIVLGEWGVLWAQEREMRAELDRRRAALRAKEETRAPKPPARPQVPIKIAADPPVDAAEGEANV